MDVSSDQHEKNSEQKDKRIPLYAVADGEVIPMEDVPDPVFSEKMIGEGFAINPSSDVVLAPISGNLFQVAESLHLFGIENAAGLKVIVHIGLDTVGLAGEGFTSKLKAGMPVKRGEPLVSFDREYLLNANKNLLIPVIVIEESGGSHQYEFHPHKKAVAGKTIAMMINMLD